MFVNTRRDAPLVPAMAAPVARVGAAMAAMVDALMKGRPERGRLPASRLAAITRAGRFRDVVLADREAG